eukprot:8835210-Alexandrium_andersonii.AAC.1
MGTGTTGSGAKARSELLLDGGRRWLCWPRAEAEMRRSVFAACWRSYRSAHGVMRPTPVGMRGARVLRVCVATVSFGFSVSSPRGGPRSGGSRMRRGFV